AFPYVCCPCSTLSESSLDASPSPSHEGVLLTAHTANSPPPRFDSARRHHQHNGRKECPGGLPTSKDPMHSAEINLQAPETADHLAAYPQTATFASHLFPASEPLTIAPHRAIPIVRRSDDEVLSRANGD